MPYEVANELACMSWAPRTNRERKAFRDARQAEWVSEATRKPAGEKIAEKLRDKPIAWLYRQQRRVDRRRRGLQLKYEALLRLPDNPVVQRGRAMLDLQAALLDQWIDGIDDRIKYVLGLTRGTGEVLLSCPVCRCTRSWVSSGQGRTEYPRWVPTRNGQ